MRIAVLGMGRMGEALAGRLIDGGHELVVWNRTPGKVEGLVERGAKEARGVAEAVSDVEVAFTSLADDDVVRAVALGDDGIRAGRGDDLLHVDASTISPDLSGELDRSTGRFASMPILGSPELVASGKAVYLLGGDEDAFALVDPLLESLTGEVHHFPSPPLAAVAKLTVNLLLLHGLVALAESFAVGRAGGLSNDQLRDLLGANNMVAPGLKNRFEGVLTGDQKPLWSPELGAKDAGLAVDVVRRGGIPVPASEAVHDLYDRLTASGGDDDVASIGRLYRP